jgi:hypothetical protein
MNSVLRGLPPEFSRIRLPARSGRAGERESGRAGERESGRAGERESGRAGERESGRQRCAPLVERIRAGFNGRQIPSDDEHRSLLLSRSQKRLSRTTGLLSGPEGLRATGGLNAYRSSHVSYPCSADCQGAERKIRTIYSASDACRFGPRVARGPRSTVGPPKSWPAR